MKGLLTGDITSNLIINLKKIFEKFMKDIDSMEVDISQIGINPKDFYDNFFQIDLQFLRNNTSKNISLNLSKHFENQGIHTKSFLYYVNLKHTQFYDLLRNKVTVNNKDDLSKEELEVATNIINNKKLYFQSILNDLFKFYRSAGKNKSSSNIMFLIIKANKKYLLSFNNIVSLEIINYIYLSFLIE